MTSKPLIRWTCGKASQAGLDCLRCSIRNIRLLYEDRFDLVICANDESVFDIGRELEVLVIPQYLFVNCLPIPPTGPAWKLYPPRLNMMGHEIYIDNDVVLYSPLDLLDEFLSRDDLWIASTAYARSYGAYDDLIADDILINSGFVGVPPGVPLGDLLQSAIRRQWTGHFDEQGVFASIISSHAYKLIPRCDIQIAHPDEKLMLGSIGTHFIGLNGGFDQHWNDFNLRRFL